MFSDEGLKRDGESMGHVNVFFNLHKGTCAPEGFYQLLEFLL